MRPRDRTTLRSLLALFLLAAAACVSDPPAPTVDPCTSYCSEITAACTGDKRQYRDEAECHTACALLPPGAEGDKDVNTVGCRLRAARVKPATKEQCTVAGAYGGGVCGTRCDAFCTIVQKNCGTQASPPYASGADCLEACAKFPFDPAVGEGPDQPFSGADNINCRGLHAILSLGSTANQQGHCPHTAIVSPVCKSE
jgi:hypothetical protein